MQIVVDKVSAGFGRTSVLENASFDVPSGAWLSLVGSSGSGKSTILNVIAGILEPLRGNIRVGDHASSKARQATCAFLQQDFPLYPSLTVKQNIDVVLQRQYQVSGASAEEILSLLEIERLLGRLPLQLSGGERQRVALARTLLLHRPVVLLDEPFSNIDTHHRKRIRTCLKALAKCWKCTVVLVSHDHEDAISTSDIVGVLHGGNLIQVGPPRDVFQRPSSTMSGQVFGDVSMVLLPADAFRSLVLPAEDEPTGAAQLGVRETDFLLSPDQVPGYLQVTVLGEEFLGSRTRLFVRHDNISFSLVVGNDCKCRNEKELWVIPGTGKWVLFRGGTAVAT